MEAPLLDPLAEWLASDGPAIAARDMHARLGAATLDWLGAYAAGHGEPGAKAYARFGGDSATDAAFRLGALSHLAEVDDGHRAAMLHPGVVTFPPLLARMARTGADLGSVRAAIVAGYEVSVRIGAAFGPGHYRLFHSTATAGTFGAAAASARLAGLSKQGCLFALGHAGTQAAGLWQFADDGAEAAKAAHAGFAARNGHAAADLAASGLPAARRILDGDRGLAAAWRAAIDPAPLRGPFGDPPALATATVKAWPVCGQMHHVLDALRDAGLAGGADPARIRRIRIASFAALSRVAGRRDPRTLAEARFATPWCVARLLLRGDLGFAAFRDPGILDDAAVSALADRVELAVDDRFDAEFPDRRRVRIDIEGDARQVVEGEGRRGDPERPFSPGELLARFEEIAAGATPAWRDRARAFAAMIEGGAEDARLGPDEMGELIHDPRA